MSKKSKCTKIVRAHSLLSPSGNAEQPPSLSNEYPPGISYTPCADYATAIQQSTDYVCYREDIYSWLLMAPAPLSDYA